jgi:hypothetical protein
LSDPSKADGSATGLPLGGGDKLLGMEIDFDALLGEPGGDRHRVGERSNEPSTPSDSSVRRAGRCVVLRSRVPVRPGVPCGCVACATPTTRPTNFTSRNAATLEFITQISPHGIYVTGEVSIWSS